MAAIHGKDTKPELYLRKLLFSKGYRYRKHSSCICGHPDIWLKKYNTAIFIHGCYWHRHLGCKYSYVPKSRVSFWQKKFDANIQRDKTVKQSLEEADIKCLIIWECTIKKMIRNSENEDAVFEKIKEFLENDMMYMEF